MRLKVLKGLAHKDLDIYNEIEDLQYDLITSAQIKAHLEMHPQN